MANYNHITLVGNLSSDITLKSIGNKTKGNFTLRCNQDKPNNDLYDDFNIVCWGKLAEVSGTYLSKGKKVLVDGRVQVRTYKDKDERKWITEVIVENIKFLKTEVIK